MKRWLLVLLTMMVCWGLPAMAEEPALTLMVYLCGSDLETSAGAATADLEEMMAHYPADGSVRVLVMASGAKKWRSGIDAGETSIYELTDAGLEKAETRPLASMGDAQTLTALLDYGYTHAPAEKYALILWDHGAGPLLGLCFDEQFAGDAGMDGLTLAELHEALADSPAAAETLAWIGFDACLMATVETAAAVAPYAEYMIASQETEPATGWSYAFLEAAGRDASGAETGRRIIADYFASLGDTLAPATLSCMDLRRMAAVSEGMDHLFDELHLALDSGSYPDFALCRVNTKSLGCATAYEYDLVDLVDLLEVYEAAGVADCSALLALLDDAIVDSRSNTDFINGLSIHYPHYGAEAETSAAAPAGYAAFMADMSAIRLGEPLTDWRERRLEAALQDGQTLVTMALTPEQAAHLDAATLFIYKEMQGDDYQLVYQTDDVALTAEGVLQAQYGNEALFLVDGEGNVLSDSLPYALVEDGLVLYGVVTTLDWSELAPDAATAAVRLIFRRDEAGEYRLSEVLRITDDPALQGKVTVDLSDYQYLAIAGSSACPVWDEAGNLLPPAQWTKGDYSYGWEFELAEHPDWGVAFRALQDGNARVAVLQLTDTQNNIVCSELTPIENPNITQLDVSPALLLENEYCRVHLTGAQLIGGSHPGLRLQLECENLTEAEIRMTAQHIQLDDAIVSRYPGGAASVAPGMTKGFHLDIDAETLAKAGVRTARRLSLDLRVMEGYVAEICRARVSAEFPADMTSVVPEKTPRIAATAVWEGLEMTLYDVAVTPERVTGMLAIRNPGAAERTFGAGYGMYLNGVYMKTSPLSSASEIRVFAGATLYLAVDVDLTARELYAVRPETYGDVLAERGVTELRSLEMTFQQGSYLEQDRVRFDLAEPLPLQQAAGTEKGHFLYERDGLSVRLMDITWTPGSKNRAINLCFCNDTETTVMFVPGEGFGELALGFGEDAEVYYHLLPQEIEPHSVRYGHAAYEDNEAAGEIVLTFTVYDNQGRRDKVQAVIVPRGEPEEQAGFLRYEAEQIEVTAEIVP